MIVTLTANPSIDRTIELFQPLRRGHVQRGRAVTTQPGGKGINVARVITAAGVAATAVLPGNSSDPLLRALSRTGIDYRAVPCASPARVNLTLTEIDGTTTKINELGETLTVAERCRLTDALIELAQDARWVVLSGSLPLAVPDDWYVELLHNLRDIRVAVDTSDAPLRAIAARLDSAPPQLLKPNADELAQLTGLDPAKLHDPITAAEAAAAVVARGVDTVLATLGAHGAVLVTVDGAWHAAPVAITPRSTVGAGDSALAGYLLADLDGAAPADRLRRAVAYGSAAVALPGTELPGPHHTDPAAVSLTALNVPHRN